MTAENIERLQDAWFFLRDANEELNRADIAGIMAQLHKLIDDELEKVA